ncbi:hypothetical protein MMC19_004663 [Ptychographa xylographoides]|nr:hypothetical protein [Ptychographa xylographoides]
MEFLRKTSKSAVFEELRKSSIKGDFDRVQFIVRTLIEDRGEIPNAKLYTALILANTSPTKGSAKAVEELLGDMVRDGITPDSATFHAVFKALAIHPDYVLREMALTEFHSRWFTLTADGWHDLAAGYLRDRQIEMALGKLEEMRKEGIRVRPWLYDLFVYNFCDTGDFDEALHIMEYRVDAVELDISATLWYYLLDSASRAYHHEATLYTWRKRVESGYLNPPSGICINVLNTAARHGDFRLATDVFRVLGNRTTSLQPYHYEALFEAYLAGDYFRAALTVLTVMASSTTALPTEATTRPLYLYLRQSPQYPIQAFTTLKNLHKANKTIPTVAINAIIEAHVAHSDLTAAITVYKSLHTLSSTGPTTATFNAIFRGCSKARRKDLAMFMAAEMLALKVDPDALTYDRLVLVCIEGGTEVDLDDAWRYFGEMKDRGWWPRRGTLVAMAKKGCERGDERIWELVEEMEGRGMDVAGVQRWVGENWRKGKEKNMLEAPSRKKEIARL